MPAAVELMNLPKLEPPAPVAAPPSDGADGPSFRQHLEQAEKRAGDDVRAPRDERPADPNDARPPERAGAKNEPTDARAPEKDAKPESGEQPAAKNDGAKGETDGDDREKQDETAEVVVAAAAVQVIVVEDEAAVAADDVVLTANVDEAPPSEGAKAATKAAQTAVVAAAVVPQSESSAKTEDAERPTVIVATPAAVDAVEKVKPVGDDAATKKQATTETAETPKQTDVAATPVIAEQPIVKPTVTAEVAQAAAHDDEPKQSDETQAEASAAEVVATPTPVDVAAATVAAAAAITGREDGGNPGDDKKSKSNGKPDDGPKNVDGGADKTRIDRPHDAEPPRPASHREAAAGRAEGNEPSRSLSHADRARLVQRVARAVQTAQERGGDLKIRLSPPELGSLRLQVRLTDGVLSARIETDTPAAQQVLVDNLPQLRERLAEQNIRVEKFDVDLFQSGGGSSQMSQQQFTQDDAARSGTIRRAMARATAAVDAGGARSIGSTPTDGGLNVVV